MERHISAEPFHPGEYIKDGMDARGWTQDDLAEVLGRTRQHINRLLQNKTAITPDTAHELARAFDTSAELWMNLQTSHDLALAAKDQRDIERRSKIYSKVPVRDIKRRGWIPETNTIDGLEKSICQLLRIENIDQEPSLKAAARKSSGEVEEALIGQVAWLCRVRELAERIPAESFSTSRIKKYSDDLHALTTSEHEVRKVPAILAKMGIRFIIVEHLPRTHIDGYTLWLDANTPVIALSLRYGRIDCFWFTLAHELSHVYNGDRPLVDNDLVGQSRIAPIDDIERRADEDASNWLIARETLNSFIARTRPRYYKRRIEQFASLHQIHPGIVVGQLQYRKEIDYRNDREMLVDVRDILTEVTLTDGWDHFPRPI
jgi:HTH-type transcriptional regulator / antitoxin HigA